MQWEEFLIKGVFKKDMTVVAPWNMTGMSTTFY